MGSSGINQGIAYIANVASLASQVEWNSYWKVRLYCRVSGVRGLSVVKLLFKLE